MEDHNHKSLREAREKTAVHLGIDLNEPHQEERIKALQKLYKKYEEGTDVRSLIYRNIVTLADRLIEIHQHQMKQLNDLKIAGYDISITKTQLENIEYQYRGEIEQIDAKIELYTNLINVWSNDYEGFKNLTFEQRQELKKLEDICWDNWLRALDVNKELRNTIIGFENRKTLLKISQLYIDYHILSNAAIVNLLNRLREDQKEGIRRYYEILRDYQLPADKNIDFKAFLQKFIESPFSESMEVKDVFMEFADIQRKQIDDLIAEVHGQYKRDQDDMIAIINYHKQHLLNQQVLFSNESERMVLYFKNRYIEKIDLLCSRFQMYHAEAKGDNRFLGEDKLNLFKKLIQEEFDNCLNELKIDYSKKAIPFLDNLWNMEQSIGHTYALDEGRLSEKMMALKMSKNLGMKSLIESFEKKRKRLQECLEKKLSLVENVDKIGINKFDSLLRELKEECEIICSYVINTNARFWTRVNAEFNCIFRRYFVRLRYEYAPYISSWRSESESWMNEYLQTNLNQELLRYMGEALEEISPESDIFKKISGFLLRFNEQIRPLMVDRDSMELEQLMRLNTLPVSDFSSIQDLKLEKLGLMNDCRNKFLKDYNNYRDQLLN